MPDISHIAPPWDGSALPGDVDLVTSVPQARLAAVLLNTCVVTPHERHAGTQETFRLFGDGPEEHGVVFYVTRAEFERYRADLQALSDITGSSFAGVKVGALRGHEAIEFLERRVLGSSWLRLRDATTLGRPASASPA